MLIGSLFKVYLLLGCLSKLLHCSYEIIHQIKDSSFFLQLWKNQAHQVHLCPGRIIWGPKCLKCKLT